MTSACWMLRACTRRNWGHGRSVLFEQRNGFKHASKKPEKIETELQNSQETTSQSSFTPIAEQVHPARIHILKQLYKPFLFTVGFSGSCFGIAAIWQYESLKNRMKTYFEDIRADWLEKIRPPKQGNFRKEVNEWWNSLSEGQKTVSGIIAANILVFCLWRVPSMQRTMIRYFTSNPASKSICLPMTLSTFSHYSFFHLAANMYVLWTFSSSIVSILGQEQFVAVYMSAGVISSFASYVSKVSIGRFGPSLGASGAIMTVLAAVCTKMPEAKLAIIFLPIFTFTAGNALKAILALDSVGLILGWRFFDHAAHLGGALFGIWYALYGHELIWKKREPFVKMWHDFRSKPPRNGGS
ncbi:PREDICTED: presenilins-associated rhomboid-like protein, mitochondrial [Nanorana parkeri]|uniref:presenilins-associated rhomboid-like protein, mitochondrial n=1 Tax=Nanorana parkeri TaxID=125878 RepID=UPI0008545A7B|nr:PREDICTED: presenilins-associated rhomboid-like protein, mitochondrial [Nanorana parkeri]XP_018432301.1 PREDICTED: presenilins-associated rhomboid-like protein, mitochondrial [Nanorana parkeri]